MLVLIQVGMAIKEKSRELCVLGILHRNFRGNDYTDGVTGSGISPGGEYLLALRLANKLADLRAANANPHSENRRFSEWLDPDGVAKKETGTHFGVPVSFCW